MLAYKRGSPAAVFYGRYRARVRGIRTVQQRNSALSDIQEDFQDIVRHEAQDRNALSAAYETLKLECWEALYGKE